MMSVLKEFIPPEGYTRWDERLWWNANDEKMQYYISPPELLLSYMQPQYNDLYRSGAITLKRGMKIFAQHWVSMHIDLPPIKSTKIGDLTIHVNSSKILEHARSLAGDECDSKTIFYLYRLRNYTDPTTLEILDEMYVRPVLLNWLKQEYEQVFSSQTEVEAYYFELHAKYQAELKKYL